MPPNSYRDGTAAGPRPERIERPAAPQGDAGRLSPGSVDELLMLPHRLLDVGREVRELRNLVGRSLGVRVWANADAVVNMTVTQLGATATGYQKAFVGPSQGNMCVVKDIFVGSDTAGNVAIYALPGDQLYTDKKGRLLGFVRLTANTPSAWFPGELVVFAGENLFLLHLASSTAKVDFSGDYCIMRSE